MDKLLPSLNKEGNERAKYKIKKEKKMRACVCVCACNYIYGRDSRGFKKILHKSITINLNIYSRVWQTFFCKGSDNVLAFVGHKNII